MHIPVSKTKSSVFIAKANTSFATYFELDFASKVFTKYMFKVWNKKTNQYTFLKKNLVFLLLTVTVISFLG